MVNTTQPPVAGILLAAGFSRRFGPQNKLTQRLPDGQMIAIGAARSLIAALPNAVAVVRKEESVLIKELAALGYQVVYCEDSQQDMSDSLKLGILHAQSQFPDMTGLVIALADMPFIQSQTIQAVSSRLTQATIVQPVYAGQPGHPVGFSSSLIAELLAITGDQGARDVLRAHPSEIIRLDCQDAGILRDIDTPADLV